MGVLLAWKVMPKEREYLEQVWPSELTRYYLQDMTEAELHGIVPEISAIVGFNSSIPQELFPAATSLRLVHILGHGVDGVFRSKDLLRSRGVVVARANPGDITIAEFVFMQMIAVSRRVMPMHTRLVMFGDWSEEIKSRRGAGSLGGELYGSTLGLVGYGSIAKQIHPRASAFGMDVGLLSRRPERYEDAGLDFIDHWDDIDAFLGKCDYVVLALPLTDGTRNLIDADRLDAMKDGSYLVNISRGGLIDEHALHDALASGKLAGAALDAFEIELTGIRDGYPTRRPLHHFNVVLTPHYASGSVEGRYRSLRTVGENLQRMLDDEPIHNVADYDDGY